MTQLSGDHISAPEDVLLRELFLQRLTVSFQMVLAASTTADIYYLATLANAAMKVAARAIATLTTH